MARQKKEDPPKGSAPWMNTFADLMNLSALLFRIAVFNVYSGCGKIRNGNRFTAKQL